MFVGDSITAGWLRYAPDFFADHARIARGIPGENSRQIRARFADDVLALRPAAVHILAGANDIAENGGPVTLAEIEANVAAMAAAARAAGAGVIIASVLPAADYPWHRGLNPGPKVIALNARLRRLAASRNYVYADYHAVLARPDGGMWADYTRDGVHPRARGYHEIAPVAEAAIARALR